MEWGWGEEGAGRGVVWGPGVKWGSNKGRGGSKVLNLNSGPELYLGIQAYWSNMQSHRL